MPILEDGQLFERYRVHKWLGSGIAGESYEAEDRILQRKVTLKLIHPWTTLSDSARRQFFREMQGVSLLNHPYLATVLDYGEIDGRVYVARRYVSSGSLLGTNGRLWFHPPLPVADAFAYAHQLAQALQYIHQHGYVHGSLTFANVLVLRGPNSDHTGDYAPFLVADTGLAHFVRRFGHPRLETLPISAAPEQQNKRVLPASDQFALAALVYFWLAGRPPYLGGSYEIVQQKLAETITPLSTLNPGVSLEQDSLILRALRAHPENRHASVLAFAEALLTSLTSPNRQYAVPTSPSAPQPETPPATLPPVADEEMARPEVAAQVETRAVSIEQASASAASAPAEDIPTPTQPGTEPLYRSALEELLAAPQRNTASDETNIALPEEEITATSEPVQQEDFVFFPSLPETPRVDEHILQVDFARLAQAETDEPLAPGHTGPLSTEPAPDALPFATSASPTSLPTMPPESTDFAQEDEPLFTNQETAPAEIASIAVEEEISIINRVEEAPIIDEKTELSVVSLTEDTQEASFASTEEISTIALAEETALASTAREDQSSPAEITPVHEEIFTSLPEPGLRAESEEQASVVSPGELPPDHEQDITSVPATELSAGPDESEITPLPAEPAGETPTPTNPIEEPALTTNISENALSVVEAAQSDGEAATETFQIEVSLICVEETEQEESQDDSTGESEKTLQRAPTIPLKELAAASEGNTSTIPLTEPASSVESIPTSAESAPATPLSEIFLVGAEAFSPTEPGASLTDDQLAFKADQSQELDLNASVREPLETTDATYLPIDEALAIPRLIVSSPYTTSSFEFLLVDEEVNIGRAGASDLYLEQDNLTSRHHALLKRVGERVLIFDKHSFNGIFLNGQKIDVGRGYELADGDHIGIGNYELIFRAATTGQISQLI